MTEIKYPIVIVYRHHDAWIDRRSLEEGGGLVIDIEPSRIEESWFDNRGLTRQLCSLHEVSQAIALAQAEIDKWWSENTVNNGLE